MGGADQVLTALWALVASVLGLVVTILVRDLLSKRGGVGSELLVDMMNRIADATEAMRDNLQKMVEEQRREAERHEERYPWKEHQKMVRQVDEVHEVVVEMPRRAGRVWPKLGE
jgi:hypothetical protein